MTELTNQVVETTRKTRLAASLLFGVWMETLERPLRRRGRRKQRMENYILIVGPVLFSSVSYLQINSLGCLHLPLQLLDQLKHIFLYLLTLPVNT